MTEYSIINTDSKKIVFSSRSHHLAKAELDMLSNKVLVKNGQDSKIARCTHHNYLVIQYTDLGPIYGCTICGYQFETDRYGLMKETDVL